MMATCLFASAHTIDLIALFIAPSGGPDLLHRLVEVFRALRLLGRERGSASGRSSKYLERIRADAGNQVRFVRRMHVSPPFRVRERFHVLACLVEIAAVLDNLRAERAHGRHLLRVVANRNDDPAGTP
jgi:hypothetical protein